jgi:hypothetical protein
MIESSTGLVTGHLIEKTENGCSREQIFIEKCIWITEIRDEDFQALKLISIGGMTVEILR